MVAKFPEASAIFQEIMACRGIEIEAFENSVMFISNPERVRLELRSILAKATRQVDKVEIALMGLALADGPKIFRPRQLDFEMLEETTANVLIEDYCQPFRTVVIELPDLYAAKKQIHCPHAGKYIYGYRQPKDHYPTMVILQYWPKAKCVLSAVYFSSDVSIKTCFAPTADETIEMCLAKLRCEDEFSGVLRTTNEEWELTRGILRAAINFCMLVDEVGHERVGPDGAEHERELRKYAEAMSRGRDKERAARARAKLAAVPYLYELDQQVQLYKTVATHNDLPGDPTGRTMPPHHRRGHWRMQAHGPERSLRKRIRIPPVFVNSYLFLGNPRDAKVTYLSE